jgi:hypothetical protein|tara:strand:- start:368 stop:625 length:258 start_codon:yes stop_codon:yes gene_type:complete
VIRSSELSPELAGADVSAAAGAAVGAAAAGAELVEAESSEPPQATIKAARSIIDNDISAKRFMPSLVGFATGLPPYLCQYDAYGI